MSVVGTIMLLAAFAGALGQFLGGDLSDRFGRKPVLLGAILFRILVFMGLALLIFREGRIWGIVLTYMAVRLSGGLGHAPGLRPPRRSHRGEKGGGLWALARGSKRGVGVGASLGRVFGFPLFPTPSFSSLGPSPRSSPCFWSSFRVQEPRTRAVAAAARGTFTAFKDPGFLRFLGTTIPVFLVAGQLVSTLSVFTVAKVGISEAQFGSLLTLNGLLVVVFQYPLARAVQGWPRRAGLALGALLYSLGYLSFGWIRSFPLMLLAMTVVTVGEMLFTPVAQAVAGGPRSGRAPRPLSWRVWACGVLWLVRRSFPGRRPLGLGPQSPSPLGSHFFPRIFGRFGLRDFAQGPPPRAPKGGPASPSREG
jgi:MFS family permease